MERDSQGAGSQEAGARAPEPFPTLHAQGKLQRTHLRGGDPAEDPAGAARDPGRGVSRSAAAGEAAGRAATNRYGEVKPAKSNRSFMKNTL